MANLTPHDTLQRKRMLVVGSSSGIGRSIAIQAVRSGARVALAARRGHLLQAVVEQSAGTESARTESAGTESAGTESARTESARTEPPETQTRGTAHAFVCDVCDERSVSEMVEDATAWLGGLDTVVYASGTAPLGLLAELDGGQWGRLLATNVVGAALVVAQALPQLRQATPGTVTLLSTHTVGNPWPLLAAYAASKAALEEFGSRSTGRRTDPAGLDGEGG